MACAQGSDDVGAPEAVQVYMPDGAPALALAKLMNEGGTDAEYHVVDSSTIQVYVTGDAPAADVCVLPVNLASKLLGTGEEYQMAVVHQPSYKCGGHLLIIQDIYPPGKLQICIKDNDLLFMDLGKIVKQQLGTSPVVRDIPEFIQNEDICFIQLLVKLRKAASLLSL